MTKIELDEIIRSEASHGDKLVAFEKFALSCERRVALSLWAEYNWCRTADCEPRDAFRYALGMIDGYRDAEAPITIHPKRY